VPGFWGGKRVSLEEPWKSEEDLERHFRGGKNRKVPLVAEMILDSPSIGSETIEKVRLTKDFG